MIYNFILKTWFWIVFIRNKEKLPEKSNIINPKMEYEIMSGAFIWEDEGLWDLRNHNLINAFRYVLNYRTRIIVGSEYLENFGPMRSEKFDKSIFEMAKKYFPNWIGFEKSRCTNNSELKERMIRIEKVVNWRMNKEFDLE